MGQRMFVGVSLPANVSADLKLFLDARPQMPWIHPNQWHITLAFLENVPGHKEDELRERLTSGFARKRPVQLRLEGGGCFPDPTRAKVLWARPLVLEGSLEELAVTARNAAHKAGAPADGRRFIPHVSLARPRRPVEATRWLQILDAFESADWWINEVSLVASYLREGPSGRPRYETVETFPLRAEGNDGGRE